MNPKKELLRSLWVGGKSIQRVYRAKHPSRPLVASQTAERTQARPARVEQDLLRGQASQFL